MVSAIAATTLLTSTIGTHKVLAQDPALTETLWQLDQILYNDGTVLTPGESNIYTVRFFEDGTLLARADCNNVRGSYDLDSPDFITLGASTLVACGPNSIDDEYRSGLQEAVNYFIQDGNLFMDLPVDTGTLRFIPAEPRIEAEVSPEGTDADADAQPEIPQDAEPVRGLW